MKPRGRPPKAKGLNTYEFSALMANNPLITKYPHAEMCQFLDALVQPILTPRRPNSRIGEQQKGMMLVPRGLIKTGIGSIALPLRYLTFNPNGRVLLTGADTGLAEERLAACKEIVEHGEAFNATYGDWRTGSAQWNAQGIKINCRTQPLKEPSIDTAGVNKEKTGGHYELIVADDLHNDKNVQRAYQREKVWRYIQGLYSLLEPGGVLILIGTRWHEDDSYGRQMARDDEAIKRGEPASYKYLVRSAFRNDGKLYAPTLLSEVALAQLRKDMDPRFFACQYLNQTIDDSERVFQEKNMHFYTGAHFYGDYPYIMVETRL